MSTPVDLAPIRASLAACSDLPWTCRCVDPETLAALVEEVESARQWRQDAETDTRALERRVGELAKMNDRRRRELSRLRGLLCDADRRMATWETELATLRGERGRIADYLARIAEECDDSLLAHVAEDVREGRDGG